LAKGVRERTTNIKIPNEGAPLNAEIERLKELGYIGAYDYGNMKKEMNKELVLDYQGKLKLGGALWKEMKAKFGLESDNDHAQKVDIKMNSTARQVTDEMYNQAIAIDQILGYNNKFQEALEDYEAKLKRAREAFEQAKNQKGEGK
jgi:hypothetical protein